MNQEYSEKVFIKVHYFIDYWRDFTYYDSIEKEQIHTIVYNPKELFKEFSEEISLYQFKHKNYKDFFLDSINTFSYLPIESIDFLQSTLTLIRGQFNNPNFDYLLHLLNRIDLLLSDFQLGIKCIDELANILTNDQKIDNETSYEKCTQDKKKQKYKVKDQIKVLTTLIIFQLVRKKYSQKFIREIFVLDEEIKTCLNRILAIKNDLEKQSTQRTYLFQIQGLKAKENDNLYLDFGDVKIYNPKGTKFLKKPMFDSEDDEKKIKELEYFGSPHLAYCNGAVTLNVVDYEYAINEAILKLNNVIDFVFARYSKYSVPITINTQRIYIVDKDGNETGGSSKADNKLTDYLKSMEVKLSENTNSLFNFYNSDFHKSDLIVNKKIAESLHWNRRAVQSENFNEKILLFWVSWENLIGEKTENNWNLGSKLLAINYSVKFAWKYFDKLSNIKQFELFGHFKKYIENLDELDQEIGLNQQSGTIYLNNLINNIDKVKSKVQKEELLYEQLEYLETIFNNPKECIKLLEKFENLAKEKILFVYKIRNKIVHDASTEINPLTEYYLDFISRSSTYLINEFIRKRMNKNLTTVKDILNDIIYDFDKLKLDIEKKGFQILINND